MRQQTNNQMALYRYLLLGTILIGCLGLALFTSTKLYKMAQIRGWVAGAQTTTYKVTQKIQTSGRYSPAYWISWTNQDINQPGNHRLNLEQEKWQKLKIGDPVQIVTVGNDSEPYLRNSIFDSDGNFIFDGLLLLAELTGAIVMTTVIIVMWRKDSAQLVRLRP